MVNVHKISVYPPCSCTPAGYYNAATMLSASPCGLVDLPEWSGGMPTVFDRHSSSAGLLVYTHDKQNQHHVRCLAVVRSLLCTTCAGV